METISLLDGLILTVVSMLLVFLVLGAIWLLTDYIAKVVNREEPIPSKEQIKPTPALAADSTKTDLVTENPKNQFVAEMIALILASEDQPDCKFEVVESQKIK